MRENWVKRGGAIDASSPSRPAPPVLSPLYRALEPEVEDTESGSGSINDEDFVEDRNRESALEDSERNDLFEGMLASRASLLRRDKDSMSSARLSRIAPIDGDTSPTPSRPELSPTSSVISLDLTSPPTELVTSVDDVDLVLMSAPVQQHQPVGTELLSIMPTSPMTPLSAPPATTRALAEALLALQEVGAATPAPSELATDDALMGTGAAARKARRARKP
ncbi:hypothetical protein HK101_009777, partial [Irineochytrium annulatum]